jgi:hypothetical protein
MPALRIIRLFHFTGVTRTARGAIVVAVKSAVFVREEARCSNVCAASPEL